MGSDFVSLASKWLFFWSTCVCNTGLFNFYSAKHSDYLYFGIAKLGFFT